MGFVRRSLGFVGRVLRRPVAWLPLLFLTTGGVGLAWGSWQNLCADCPSIAQIHTWEPQQTSKLYSHDGVVITEIGYRRRTPISLEALPTHVPQAFVAVEDKRFYQHSGVDPRGVARAVFGLLTGQSERTGGGSTLTQQLARNMFEEEIGYEKRILRKLKEMQVAFELERVYSKDQILEAYINQVYYGRGYGIQTASRNYFGKNATDLNPAEAAFLAAVVNNPGRYNPFTRPENARSRRNLVLELMADQGYLSRDEAERWKAHPLPTEDTEWAQGVAPYFEEWVRQILDDRFGSKLYTAGLRVYTTLDVEMQRIARQEMERQWAAIEAEPGFGHPSYEESAERTEPFENGQTPYLQGVFIALDPSTGHVRALVGGRDFEQSVFNRATQARRQAGSAFKPFVYTAAIASGIPASHIVVDAPVVYQQPGMSEEWKPRNFDGEFHGPMTLREGLRRSINMVAIKLGNEEVGLETVAQTAQRMGIRTEIERFPSTTIGAAEVIPLQLAEAYTAFANLGTKVRPFPILRVEDADGQVIWEPQPERAPVLDSLVARIMVDMMEDVVNRGTGVVAIRQQAGLPYEVPAAGKTGTTNDATDVWFNGFTPNLQALVWFGMDRPVRIFRGAQGGRTAGPVWGRFMRRVYYGDEAADDDNGESADPILPIPEPWPMLSGLTTRVVDERTGLLASEWCPEEDRYQEIYLPGTEPSQLCDRFGPYFGSPGDYGDAPPEPGGER